MFGTGVASFGHIHGYHVQNLDRWEDYLAALDRGELPLNRAFPTGPRDRMIREFILQLKTGRLEVGYFRRKFGTDVIDEFRTPLEELDADGFLTFSDDEIELTRSGLLQIDRQLPKFFDPQFRTSRYT
jgi:oxygen-independent coproporphyrinogen-3 oxidase